MAGEAGPPITWLFFLDVMLVACFARVVSYPLYRLKIPRIIGDIIAGCLLGPTVLQGGADIIFPPENRPLLKIFGTFGLILASATSGAAFDRKVLQGMEVKVAIFAVFNIGITFGSVYILLLFFPKTSKFHGPNYNEIAYSMYLGSVMCATSLPMAFLILDELKMTNILAKFMIGAATVSTILLFTLASVANSFAYPPSGVFGSYLAVFRIGVLAGIIVVLWIFQRIWQTSLRKEWHRWFWRTSTDQSVLILTLCVGCAVATDQLGYTVILGAFLAGAFLPSPVVDPLGDESKAAMIRSNFPKLVKFVSRWVMLPCYFLCIGLQLDIRYINADWGWVVLALVWGMAFKMLLIPICKFGLGMSFNDSCFATLIGNCRGFNALIIGAAAQDAGQFGDVTYALSVLFSVITSCLAGWLCQVFYRRERKRLERVAAQNGVEPQTPLEPELPLHLAVAPFFGDNTGELLGAAQPSGASAAMDGDGREHSHAASGSWRGRGSRQDLSGEGMVVRSPSGLTKEPSLDRPKSKPLEQSSMLAGDMESLQDAIEEPQNASMKRASTLQSPRLRESTSYLSVPEFPEGPGAPTLPKSLPLFRMSQPNLPEHLKMNSPSS